MIHDTDAVTRSPLRRARLALPGLLVAATVMFSACATPAGSVAPPSTPSVSPTSSPSSPSPSAVPSAATASPAAKPSASSTPDAVEASDAPFNGEILIVTSEVRDGRLQVSAMVPRVSESGGTCTLTLVATGASTSSTANEGKDVTYCGLMSIPVGEDTRFQVAYRSRTTSADSAVTTVEPTP